MEKLAEYYTSGNRWIEVAGLVVLLEARRAIVSPGSRNLGNTFIVKSNFTKVTIFVPRGVIQCDSVSAIGLIVEVLPTEEAVAMRILELELITSHVGFNTCALAVLHAVEDVEVEILGKCVSVVCKELKC